jgi:hypothetical protein
MAATVPASGVVRQLDRPASPDEVMSEVDAQNAVKLARVLLRILKDVATLKRRWWPDRIDFEDFPVSTAGATVTLNHGLGGRVRWWLVDWESSGTTAPILKRTSATTNDSLVLASYVAGTATIRVEAAGG